MLGHRIIDSSDPTGNDELFENTVSLGDVAVLELASRSASLHASWAELSRLANTMFS